MNSSSEGEQERGAQPVEQGEPKSLKHEARELRAKIEELRRELGDEKVRAAEEYGEWEEKLESAEARIEELTRERDEAKKLAEFYIAHLVRRMDGSKWRRDFLRRAEEVEAQVNETQVEGQRRLRNDYREYRRARLNRRGALVGVIWRRTGWWWPTHHTNLLAASLPGDLDGAW